jgi:homogentisate 1,2-dioxygenase
MRRRIILAVLIAVAQLCVIAVAALAQNSQSAPAAAAHMKAKPKTPAGGTVTVKVTNWREADLVELRVVESGSANWKKVLGALKAGQWTWVKVPQGKNCRVDLRGKYADGKLADVSNVDICTDKTVDLVN